MKKLLLSLLLLIGCGNIPLVEETQPLAQIPPPPDHNQNGPWICQFDCGATVDSWPNPNHCPCVLNPPPLARWQIPTRFANMPKQGETMFCNGTYSQNTAPTCVIMPTNTSYDYHWLSFAGWESQWTDHTTKIMSVVLGPQTSFAYSFDYFFGPIFPTANWQHNSSTTSILVYNFPVTNSWISSIASMPYDPF